MVQTFRGDRIRYVVFFLIRKLQSFTLENFQVCRFSCSLCSTFESFCDQESSKHSKPMKLAMQFLASKVLQKWP